MLSHTSSEQRDWLGVQGVEVGLSCPWDTHTHTFTYNITSSFRMKNHSPDKDKCSNENSDILFQNKNQLRQIGRLVVCGGAKTPSQYWPCFLEQVPKPLNAHIGPVSWLLSCFCPYAAGISISTLPVTPMWYNGQGKERKSHHKLYWSEISVNL